MSSILCGASQRNYLRATAISTMPTAIDVSVGPSSVDIFPLTMTAQLPLHTAGPPSASPRPPGMQYRDHVGELEEIREAERRPPGGDHDERIVGDDVCPTRRNLSELAVVV